MQGSVFADSGDYHCSAWHGDFAAPFAVSVWAAPAADTYNQNHRHSGGEMFKPKRDLLSAALTSVIALAAMQAQAQETPEPEADDATELDRVRVTGIRSAIE